MINEHIFKTNALKLILASLAFVLPFIGMFSPRSYGALVPVIAVSAMVAFFAGGARWQAFKSPVWICLVAALGLVGMSIFWSLDTEIAVNRWLKLVLFLPLGLALISVGRAMNNNTSQALVERSLLAGFSVFFLLLLLHNLAEGGVFVLLNTHASDADVLDAANRPSVVLLIAFGAIFVALQRTRFGGTSWPVAFGVLVVFFSTRSQSAMAGMVVWLLVCAVATFSQRAALLTVKWGGVILILSLPFVIIALHLLSHGETFDIRAGSASARLEVWYAVAFKILESPIWGHGLEAARSIKDWAVDFRFFNGPNIPHPHNGILQLWLEFGVIGALAASAGWVWLAKQVERFDPEVQPPILASLVAFLFVTTVSHGLWQSWWINAVFGVIALTVLVAGPMRERTANKIPSETA